MTKGETRHFIRQKRGQLEKAWIAEASRAAQERLAGLPVFERASAVFCYLALEREVQTAWLIDECLRTGKTVGVPCRKAEGGPYAVAGLGGDTETLSGPFGLREPVAPHWLRVETIELVVVPGVAFDASGGRVGHGGGHYDRLLAGVGTGGRMDAEKVGLAFEFQLMGRVEKTRHDIDMDWVVTERRAVRCRELP